MWTIKQTEEFQDWFDGSDKALQDDTLEHMEVLRQFGPQLGRLLVDTLKERKNDIEKEQKKIKKKVKTLNPNTVKKGKK